MDKLNIYLGGDPLYYEDIIFSQDSVRDSFKGVLSAFVNGDNDTFIISGCTATFDGTLFTVAPGYICFRGELCKVDEHTTSVLNEWRLLITYDPDGNQVYDDTSIHDTQEVRKAKIYPTIDGGGAGQSCATTRRIEARLIETLATAHNWLTTFAFIAPFMNYDAGIVYDQLSFKTNKITNTVFFKGHIKRSPGLTHTADVHMFTISDPASVPSKQREITGVSLNEKPVTIVIKTDGTVWAKASPTNTFDSGNISFDGLNYAL